MSDVMLPRSEVVGQGRHFVRHGVRHVHTRQGGFLRFLSSSYIGHRRLIRCFVQFSMAWLLVRFQAHRSTWYC